MADKGRIWERVVKQHKLQPRRLDEVALWPFGDFVFRQSCDVISSMTKIRTAGFHDTVDTEELYLSILRQYREALLCRRWQANYRVRASRHTPRRRALRHDAGAAALATAQAFDELRHRRAPEARKIALGDDAAMPAPQAAHRDHPALRFAVRTRGHSTIPTQQLFNRDRANLGTDSRESTRDSTGCL